MTLPADHLATLRAILQSGSFEGAARGLGVTQSAVSQRLKALESRVGAQLVRRGAPCTATGAGERLAAHADQAALLEAHLARDLAALAPPPQTRLRLAVNADSLATWLPGALAALDGQLFDLVIDDQDTAHDRLVRGEVLGAITSRAAPLPGCDVTPLGRLRYIAVASASFIARHFAGGVNEAALARAPMLQFDARDQLQHRWITRHTGAALSPPCHRLPSAHGFATAARLGLGWGMNPEPLIARDLRRGTLAALVADCPLDTPLYWQSSRLLGAAMAPLTRALRRAARAGLLPPM
ncbi:LysR family transcriptional regulator (chromosome initiation inhibitor) [Roseovarius sp. MBR-78]|jgi:LysR family transcriptional regulator (chromosome initiation inhibitor)|uniref:LysR family transcriptional regulator ArgP n=1 Tax=Roseovarius sp. MBR-78 TaxID=3156460 RepID=UPI0033984BB2